MTPEAELRQALISHPNMSINGVRAWEKAPRHRKADLLSALLFGYISIGDAATLVSEKWHGRLLCVTHPGNASWN